MRHLGKMVLLNKGTRVQIPLLPPNLKVFLRVFKFGRVSRVALTATVLKTVDPKRVCGLKSHFFRQVSIFRGMGELVETSILLRCRVTKVAPRVRIPLPLPFILLGVWPRGLRHWSRKPAAAKAAREFESHRSRQLKDKRELGCSLLFYIFINLWM